MNLTQAYSISVNFAVDLLGYQSGSQIDSNSVARNRTVIRAPEGYRVRIVRVYGDFVIWPVGSVQFGRFAGANWGLQSSERPDTPETPRLKLSSDDNGQFLEAPVGAFNDRPTLISLQGATGGTVCRVPFSEDVSAAGLLADDGELLSTMAVWLNDTGRKIHLEATFTVVFCYERKEGTNV